ncbi:hypothetical protein ACFO26_02120 [Lactococcus nasutitermitis]|uniref:Uncharacterized protein n=1 Tax=Lactococcus nasutitermitis TaxID=1652957 RepID=A0ABV9JC79_9LACT|nr:hypothetical protein [Lactococcus nasutitermitis]
MKKRLSILVIILLGSLATVPIASSICNVYNNNSIHTKNLKKTKSYDEMKKIVLHSGKHTMMSKQTHSSITQ